MMNALAELPISAPTANAAVPRVAYFPDSFHEINGVAHTSRHFEAFARRRDWPFLCIRAGERTPSLVEEGSVWTLELPRGFLSFALEKDLRFDPAFMRHFPLIQEVIERFQPEVIHITGPSELGMLGAGLAHSLKLPLAASWHTNVHEYLARRSDWFLRLLPERQSTATAKKIEDLTMAAAALFYGSARVLYAPNPALCQRLTEATERPCHLMPRGVDAILFNPTKRQRAADDDEIVLGFVGRLSVEKNVALLADIQKNLDERQRKIRFCIVGHGNEEPWLREHLHGAEFTGVLRGEALAKAYANMDIFVFPSHTDTFGNVVLEAMASGVPTIVTPDGGPPTIVRDQLTGRIVDDDNFAAAIEDLLDHPNKLRQMRIDARAYAETASWDAVFEGVYRGYEPILNARTAASVQAALLRS
jgi:glycosyltransferase involved in cell wall biosynthesis